MTASSNAFIQFIHQVIEKKEGTLSFAEFMELVLYHPRWGYYNNKNIDIGKLGDFTTAPEMSSLFAQCFAKQCRQIFEYLGEGYLLEIGAGTGQFAKDF